jgi:AraC-like DNA-binding protein
MPSKKRTAPPIRDVERPALERARRYVEANYARKPELSEIAQVAKLSPFHFHRRFQLCFRETAKGMIDRLRIAEAKRLLLAGTSQLEVAAQMGFAHQAHFCSRFRQLENVTPGRWLQNHHEAGACGNGK